MVGIVTACFLTEAKRFSGQPMIRKARQGDLNSLVEIEQLVFETDRFTRRNFRYLLTKANAVTLVYDELSHVLGYVTLLFNSGTSLARMYSLAVHPDAQKKGVGTKLIKSAEQEAIEHDCITLRLEVRRDNEQAIRRYESMGYRQFGTRKDYYEDHMEALVLEKRLEPKLKPELARVPYYRQTLEFTCGPAALMMAMKALDPKHKLSRKQELQLWRESTTIYMTSGHGGCGPHGLALSAFHMGFDVELYVKQDDVMFLDSVRSQEKKDVMRLVQEDFVSQLKKLKVKIHHRVLSVSAMLKKFEQGGIPIVLISSYRIYREKFPHWVVVTGFDDKYIYVHDPYVDIEHGKSVVDTMNMPILRKEFETMARYGKSAQQAALVLYRREERGEVQH
jgi:ribosomal-protein-alanine acetyltransferase